MLSICIPVFNLEIAELYSALQAQIDSSQKEIEIVVIDDGSKEAFKIANRKTCVESTYIELPENVGRAKIRNLFLKHTKYDNLLFLDCDSKITDINYLQNYIKLLNKKTIQVVFGGSYYHAKKPNREHLLRWEYGTKKENKPIQVRKKLKNKAFLTNNFLIERTVFEKNKFDESLTKYGYEDTLFGYNLTLNGYRISQIDNPVLNNEFDTNIEYLNKVRESIDNLHIIIQKHNYDEGLFEHIKLLKAYKKIEQKKILKAYNLLFKLKKPVILALLKSGYYGNLALFNYYKLGLICEKLSKK